MGPEELQSPRLVHPGREHGWVTVLFLQVCEGQHLPALTAAIAPHRPLQVQLLPLPEPLPVRVPAL